MVDWYVVWLAACGVPVQMWLGWRLGKGIVKAGWAACCAVSVCRWGMAVGAVHGYKYSKWRWIPGLLASEWWSFVSSPYDSITSRCHGGAWNGIGNWSVFPRQQSEHDAD